MKTADIINKVAEENNISHGRAEMIINIISERIIEKIKHENKAEIADFGEFIIVKKDIDPIYNPKNEDYKIQIIFKPHKNFLDIINS